MECHVEVEQQTAHNWAQGRGCRGRIRGKVGAPLGGVEFALRLVSI